MRNDIKNLIDAVVFSDMACKIESCVKCKTKDGTTAVIECNEYEKDNNESLDEYANRVYSDITECFLHSVEQIERETFPVFLESMTCIRNSEITRIWVEIGDIYIS